MLTNTTRTKLSFDYQLFTTTGFCNMQSNKNFAELMLVHEHNNVDIFALQDSIHKPSIHYHAPQTNHNTP